MHLALGHLGEFAVVESWSGYFDPTDPTGTKAYIAFYVGRADARFAAENVQLHRGLARAQVPHVFRLYGGGHEQSLWQRHARPWLGLALSHLAPARPG
ncbi:MAG: hypothetical protein V7644_2048 [Actinomycetota bacterium]|jgi:S-formylglutathione hydrolase FrmB